MDSYPKLFIPGPTHVPNRIMRALSTPQIGHRTEEISKLIKDITEGIKRVLYTKNKIFLMSHAATGLWEMGLVNSISNRVLHCTNGAFSSKWAKMSESCGYNYKIIEYDWGKGIKADDIDSLLSTNNFDVLAIVHNETSTGVMSNLEEISEMLQSKYPEVIWLVDAVSSMAGAKIDVDRLGIDFLLSSTQKAWGLPAGFAICSVSEKMIHKSKGISNKGYFLDLMVYEKYMKKHQTPSTPSVPHLFGLKEVLRIIEDEGLENRWKRHLEMRNHVIKWALSYGQEIYSEVGCQSSTVTCIRNVREWDIDRIYFTLLERGFRMDRGYGALRGKAFRIPHMGNIYMDDIGEYLNEIEKVLNV